VDQRQVLAVHLEDDQRVRLHRLGDRHAARERRLGGVAAEMRIGAVLSGIDRARLHAGGLEHVGQPHTGPFGAARAAVGPLVAASLRREERTAVAAALQHHLVGDAGEAAHQIAQRDLHGLVDLTVDLDLPGPGVSRRVGHQTVVADEELVDRRDVVVHQLGLGLGNQRLVAQNDELGLAVHFEKFRALCRRGCGGCALREGYTGWRQGRADRGDSDALQHVTPGRFPGFRSQHVFLPIGASFARPTLPR